MIDASFDPKKTNAASVAGAVQYDTGQRLRLNGLPTPEELAQMDDFLDGDVVSVQVQYAYEGDSQTESRIATYDEMDGVWTVDVPDTYLQKNYPVGFFVYVGYGAEKETSEDGTEEIVKQRNKTMYVGAFTPKSRPAPGDKVTPDQVNAWDALVAEVNLALASVNTATSNANAAATLAAGSAEKADAATQKANEAYNKISAFEMDSVKSVNGSKPDESGNVSVKVGVAGAAEGDIPTFDANGDLVTSGKNLYAFTRAKMVLDGTTLTITTID